MNKEIKALFHDSNRFLIIPACADEDSLSSAIVLKRVLDSKGMAAKIIHYSPIPQKFAFLPFFETIEIADPSTFDYTDYGVVITVDAGSLKQIMDVKASVGFTFPSHVRTLSIDHHRVNTPFAQLCIYEPGASSTAELIYLYFIDDLQSGQAVMSHNITPNEATVILAGIIGDTGFFKWNMSPRVMRISEKLLEKGADNYFITNYLYYNKDIRVHDFLKYCLPKIEFFADLKFMLLTLTQDDLQKMGIKGEDLHIFTRPYHEMITDVYEGYDYGGILIQENEMQIMGSFRGNPYLNKVNLAELCKLMSVHGGGHFNAAGFIMLNEEFAVCRKRLLTQIEAQFHESRNPL